MTSLSAKNKKNLALIGYSGHAFVVYDIAKDMGLSVTAYCDANEKSVNPHQLTFLGKENDPRALALLKEYEYFVSIGNNNLRKKITLNLQDQIGEPVNIIHSSARISESAMLSTGIMISFNVCINAFSEIGKGVICNTGCIIEHECKIGDFVHIAPGAVLCGNVEIGHGTLVGAGSVIKPGVSVGENAIIGSGAVIVKDIPDNVTVVGNPQKTMK